MKYPISMSYVDILSDYYKNHADDSDRNIIEDELSKLLFDLGFVPDDNSEFLVQFGNDDEESEGEN